MNRDNMEEKEPAKETEEQFLLYQEDYFGLSFFMSLRVEFWTDKEIPKNVFVRDFLKATWYFFL